MQPLPVIYKNIEFRSRLEARWAVFFDSLRISWKYEDEAYETSTGKYLPDFWLPDVYLREIENKGVLFEVRPETCKESTDKQLEELAEKLGVGSILAVGFRFEKKMWSELYQITPSWDNNMMIYPCANGHVKFDYSDSSYFHCVHDYCAVSSKIGRDKLEYDIPVETVQKAYMAATSFRFG